MINLNMLPDGTLLWYEQNEDKILGTYSKNTGEFVVRGVVDSRTNDAWPIRNLSMYRIATESEEMMLYMLENA